jgi:hypothetical protein
MQQAILPRPIEFINVVTGLERFLGRKVKKERKKGKRPLDFPGSKGRP